MEFIVSKITKSANGSLIDWVASLKPEWSDSALANYEKRNSLKDVEVMAKLKEKFRENFDNDIDYIFASSLWHVQESTKPINKNRKIDRMCSMVSGFPWTSASHPWPINEEGRMAPVFQLNLATLNLEFIDAFPALLLQVWCDNDYKISVRTIPLPEAETEVQSEEYFDTSEYETVGYDYIDKNVIGEYIFCNPNKKKFITSSHLGGDWSFSEEDEEGIPPDQWDFIHSQLEKMHDKHKDNQIKSGFGGEPYCWQNGFMKIYKDGWKPLFKVKNKCGEDGISIFFDGYVALFYRKCEGSFEFMCLDGR